MTNEEREKNPKEYYFNERQIRDAYSKYKKAMLEKDFSLILRVTMQLTDGVLGQFQATGSPMSMNYTGNHIAIFECELKHPPILGLIDHTSDSYILASRINFKNWRLVDVDNFMKGNPPYSNFVTQVDWDKKVDSLTASKSPLDKK